MKRIDFEHGTITGNILGTALPMLVAQILSLLYNIVDRIYIARIPEVGTTALGAVGLCFPIIVIITAFSNLFGSGGAPLFSINRGKGNTKKAETIMNTSFSMMCICGVVLTVIGMMSASPILVLFGASEEGLSYAYPYMMSLSDRNSAIHDCNRNESFINAQGYATSGMLSVTIGAVANLILDPLFIFGIAFRNKRSCNCNDYFTDFISSICILFFKKKIGDKSSNALQGGMESMWNRCKKYRESW